MSRTFISQPEQIFSSENYDDTLAVGSGLQTGSTNLEMDLNAIRTQIRQILWANVSGSWYDAVTPVSGTARGLNTLNVDLTDLEQKRFLFRRQNLIDVSVATGSIVVELSQSLGSAPLDFAAVGETLATGSVVAELPTGSFGVWSNSIVSGSTAITPKNIVIVRDGYTSEPVTDPTQGDAEVFGLLQVEFATVSGDSFNDTNHRTQLSFVVQTPIGTLVPASPTAIGGRVVNYSYVRRVNLDNIPEDAYLTDTIFLDPIVISGTALFTDITLQNAINNQVGTVTQNKNIAIALGSGFSWSYLSGTKTLWQLLSGPSDELTVAVDRLNFSSSFPASFENGIQVATGSTQVNVGVLPGQVSTNSGSNLTLVGGNFLNFNDFYNVGSIYSGAIALASSTLEWNNFATYFSPTTTVLGALTLLSQSISGSTKRLRKNAGVTTNLNAGDNVTFPTNLDAQLLDYSGKNFVSEVNVFLNGVLLLPGTGPSLPNDVRPGTTPSTGDLIFSAKLRSGSILSMEVF